MTNWTLSGGIELPDPRVPLYYSPDDKQSRDLRASWPTDPTKKEAFATYQRARNNASELIADARLLQERGRFARAFALACTALEEIGKSQLAADVYTGFVPSDGFSRLARDHPFKSAYAMRGVMLNSLMLYLDEDCAEGLFQLRNDALYASATNAVDNAAFMDDAPLLADYCDAWLESISRQEEISERIGTRAFLK